MSESAIIIGGGLAGLAAAAALAQRGIPVTLLESRPRLGGRASSFIDRTTATEIDNCQHVTMGCCTNFRHFCQTVGIDSLFQTETELNFIGPPPSSGQGAGAVRSASTLRASPLPAPLHLAPAFSRLDYLSLRDKLCLARGLRALARTASARCPDQSFENWLHEHKQTPTAIERFWHVVLVSALSESLDRISVAHARKVFVDAFLANRHGWEVQIPIVPLNRLYGEQLTGWLQQRGVTVQLQSGVQRLHTDGRRAIGVELRDGVCVAASQFVVAVPHHLVLAMLPESLRRHPQLEGVARIEDAPIASVHLWFDRPITSLRHSVFVGRLSQWMFNRSAIQGDRNSLGAGFTQNPTGQPGGVSPRRTPDLIPVRGLSPPGSPLIHPQHANLDRSQCGEPFYYQIVISASRGLAGQDETISQVLSELTEVWPDTAQAQLVHSRLVTEHRAVFSVRPGADALRPAQQSPLPNVQLAGDWTQTGWPATMEGAVRSGYLAAENVLTQLGRPEMLLQPDLPVSPLAKLLL